METSLRICLCVLIVQQAAGAAKHGGEKMGARVVIHVGPHKTGTKSVQSGLRDRKSLLKIDAWTMPSPEIFIASLRIAYMYVPEKGKTTLLKEKGESVKGSLRNPSTYDYNRWLKTIAQLKGTTHNELLSCERFCKADKKQIAELASDLSQTTTTIVMVYRPYYEWMASMYREINGADDGAVPNSTKFVDWLFPPHGSRSGSTSVRRAHSNISSVYRRYAVHFSDIRVHTLGPNLVTEIVCDDLNATRTCAVLRKSTMEHKHISPKGSLSYGCLSPLQLQELEDVSADLHKEMFGSLLGFSTSDLHAQALTCFGNR